MSVAIVLDLFLKDPASAFHPVAVLGRILGFLEKFFYPFPRKKVSGGLFYFFSVSILSFLIQLPLFYLSSWWAYFYLSFWAYFLLCGKTLCEAGKHVKTALEKGLEEAREALSHYVGRSTKELCEEEILKGTIETMAENTSDGIVGPLVFLFLGYVLGLPLLFMAIFKLTNTLDSMVGYNNRRYQDFGYVSAKMDDLLGIIPARLTALLFLLMAEIKKMPVKEGWRIYLRDRKKHLSPNAGHSESAIAGLLGISLGGGHQYGDQYVEKPALGDPRETLSSEMIDTVAKLLFLVELFFLPLSLALELL